MSKRFILFGLLIILCFSICGCWDRAELESLGLVQALGLDLDKKDNKIVVTTMIAIPSKLAGTSPGGGKGEGPGVALISMKAPSIYDAFNLINTTLNREVSLLQNQTLILGENLAKQGVHRWIDTLVRFREMRRTLLIFTCQGKAADILKIQPEIDPNPAEYFRDLVLLSKNSGMYPLTNLHDFMRRYEAYSQQNYTPLLAPYEKEEKGKAPSPSENGKDNKGDKKEESPKAIRIIGTAVFRGDKMVGKLDLYESQVLQLLTNQFREALLSIEDPQVKNNVVVFRLSTAKPALIKYSQKEVAHFKIRLSLEANILSIQSKVDYSQPDKERLLSNRISAALVKRIRQVIKKSQKEFRSDIFGFGGKVRNTMLTSTQWDKYGWPHKYPSSRITVKVLTHIRRVGVQFQPPQERD